MLLAGAAAAAAFISRPNPAACELLFDFTISFECSFSAALTTSTLLVTEGQACFVNMAYLVKTAPLSAILISYSRSRG